MAAADTCGNCSFFAGKALDPKKMQAAQAAGFQPGGFCRRFPEPVTKSPDEWCGEHKRRK